MSTTRHLVVCVRNEGHEESLELRKIYERLDDPVAEKRGFLRIVDEEEEDYLYPRSWFLSIQLPDELEEAVLKLAS